MTTPTWETLRMLQAHFGALPERDWQTGRERAATKLERARLPRPGEQGLAVRRALRDAWRDWCHAEGGSPEGAVPAGAKDVLRRICSMPLAVAIRKAGITERDLYIADRTIRRLNG